MVAVAPCEETISSKTRCSAIFRPTRECRRIIRCDGFAPELPLYHPVARMARVTGTVEVQVSIKDRQVVVAEGKSGPAMLLKATIENIKTWRFSTDANTTFLTTFVYRLEGKETSRMQNPKIEMELPVRVTITATPTKRPCEDCGPDVE
jgi:hypothetical protein